MEFGWYHEFHRQVPDQSDADAFAQGFEQVEAADEWGLDVFWVAEIHQQAKRSVLSAPLIVAAQIAARTKRIKIGTAVQVLPLAHPLRLAEETATIDVVSRGRFILGAGRSGNPRGYAAYGIPYAESRERFFLRRWRFSKRPGRRIRSPTTANITVSTRHGRYRDPGSGRIRRSASPARARIRFRPWAGSATRCSSRCAAIRWSG